MRVETVDLHKLGRIDVLDLNVISEYLGRDFLPFPFVPTQPNRFADLGAYRDHARSIPDRFNHGDLAIFKKWFGTLADADIRVECRVQQFAGTAPDLRVIAHRSGEFGFLAAQQPDDVIDIFSLSHYLLGPAVAGLTDLTNPGDHPSIVIPDYTPQSLRGDRDHAPITGKRRKPPVKVAAGDVRAYASVQSHLRPARTWGPDQDKDAVIWVRLDDGDYIYAPDYRCAKPMTRRYLSERVDGLIAADVGVLRRARG